MTKKDKSIENEIQEMLNEFELALNEEASSKVNENQIKIQPVEEYFIEIGYGKQLPKKLHKDYPDLFGIKLKKKNDMMSESPGVEVTPATQLYASLLTYKHEQTRKKRKGKNDRLPNSQKKT